MDGSEYQNVIFYMGKQPEVPCSNAFLLHQQKILGGQIYNPQMVTHWPQQAHRPYQ